MLKAVCKTQKLHGLYLHFHLPAEADPLREAVQAAPFLDPSNPDIRQIIQDGFGYLFFEDLPFMRQCFEKARGPDGPNPNNAYPGPAYVYLVACDSNGEILGDNTKSSPLDSFSSEP
jgi:hypothetical protein